MSIRDQIVEAALELTRIVGERYRHRYEPCEFRPDGLCYCPDYDDEPGYDACDPCKRNYEKKPRVIELAKQRKTAAQRLYRLCRRLEHEGGDVS